MSIYQLVAQSWRGKVRTEEIASQLASSQWSRVWERLNDQVWSMSRHERRGYIRARGALVVQEAVEHAVRQRHLQPEVATSLYVLTMDRVVSQVVEHMSARLPQARRARLVA